MSPKLPTYSPAYTQQKVWTYWSIYTTAGTNVLTCIYTITGMTYKGSQSCNTTMEMASIGSVRFKIYHHHHLRAASEGHCVTSVPWSWDMADLHNIEGMLPVLLRIWSTHLLFGRPGRFQSRTGRRPSDRSTWAWTGSWAGTSSLSLTIWPKIAVRRLAICSPTDCNKMDIIIDITIQ